MHRFSRTQRKRPPENSLALRAAWLPAAILLAQSVIASGAERSEKPWLHQEVRMRLFSPAWRNLGEQTPDQAARRFEVIYGHLAPEPFHRANPQCKMLKYLLGPYATRGEMAKLPPAAMAHDRDGNVVKARDWPNWLVVPDSQEWIEYDAGTVLGAATGEMQPAGRSAVYFRTFENGFIVVNPTEKAAEGVIFPGTAGRSFKSWGEDRSVKFPATVEGHTGLILTLER